VAPAVSLLAAPADFLGLGKVWDQFRPRDGSQAGRAWLSSGEIAVILLLVIAGIALSFQSPSRRLHDVETIDRQGSEPVRVHVQMPAGELKLSGSANNLMEADFNYDEAEGKPEASYRVSGGTGELDITQPGKKFHFGPAHNDWTIRLANDVPMQLKVDMGAGQSDLKVGNLRSPGSISAWVPASSPRTLPATGRRTSMPRSTEALGMPSSSCPRM
jgi:hypothetical protein